MVQPEGTANQWVAALEIRSRSDRMLIKISVVRPPRSDVLGGSFSRMMELESSVDQVTGLPEAFWPVSALRPDWILDASRLFPVLLFAGTTVN